MDIFVESWLVISLGTVFPRTPPPGARSPLYSAVGYTDMPVLHHAALMCTAIKHCQLHALIIGQPAGPYRVSQQMDALACGTKGWTSFGSLRKGSPLHSIFLDSEEWFHRKYSSGASIVWCSAARAAHPLLAMTPLCVAQLQHTVVLIAALLSCLLIPGSRRTGKVLPWKVIAQEVFHNPLPAFLCRPRCKCWPLPT